MSKWTCRGLKGVSRPLWDPTPSLFINAIIVAPKKASGNVILAEKVN